MQNIVQLWSHIKFRIEKIKHFKIKMNTIKYFHPFLLILIVKFYDYTFLIYNCSFFSYHCNLQLPVKIDPNTYFMIHDIDI